MPADMGPMGKEQGDQWRAAEGTFCRSQAGIIRTAMSHLAYQPAGPVSTGRQQNDRYKEAVNIPWATGGPRLAPRN